MPEAKKVVLITGSTGGIGRATALLLAQTNQYDLALHYNTASVETRTNLHNTLLDANPSLTTHFFQADLSTYSTTRAFHKAVTNLYPKIDILFLNAGTTLSTLSTPPNPPFSSIPIETYEEPWRTNTACPILLAQLCLPAMEAQAYGRIIFNTSVAALTGGIVGPHYASSKSALHGFVYWLGGQVAGKGVTVNAVAPALIGGTGMLPGDEGELGMRIPVGRVGRGEEVARTVEWLIQCAYVTRKVIAVDGGMVAH